MRARLFRKPVLLQNGSGQLQNRSQRFGQIFGKSVHHLVICFGGFTQSRHFLFGFLAFAYLLLHSLYPPFELRFKAFNFLQQLAFLLLPDESGLAAAVNRAVATVLGE